MPKKYHKQYYNRTNTCDSCGNKLGSHDVYREYKYEEGINIWTGRWLCGNCGRNNNEKIVPNSRRNLLKSLADRRTGNLDPNSEQAKGDLFEELTCRWREVKNLNIENDNYRSPIDHSPDPELGIIQTKGRLYDTRNRTWTFYVYRDRDKNFDNMICYCADKDGIYIERIYIFPKKEIFERANITIYKNPSRIGWYEKYRIKDEKVLELVNRLYQEIIANRRKRII